MTLIELIQQVKDEKLSREALESYRDQLSHLYADLQIEMSSLEKEEAIFMGNKTPDNSVAEMKVFWKASPSGQRLIVLKRYALACKEMLNSLRSRLFNFY
jgi:hypothetical protein